MPNVLFIKKTILIDVNFLSREGFSFNKASLEFLRNNTFENFSGGGGEGTIVEVLK